MWKNKKVFCFIAARGRSKGLPRKNILMIAGKPLISHSIDTAKKIKIIDEIFVSTEDDEIKNISKKSGAQIIDRPKELATDTSNILDVFKHMINQITETKNDNAILVIFYPTAPIRNIVEMEKCIKIYDEDVDIVISVSESKIRPNWLFIEKKNFLQFWQEGKRDVNRQEQKEKFYYLTGSIFVTSSQFLKAQNDIMIAGRIKKFVVDEKHAMDIDTKFDFELCKFVMESF